MSIYQTTNSMEENSQGTTNEKFTYLKGIMNNITDSFSVMPNDVTLDMPESLNQIKLIHTPLTDSQAETLAETQCEPTKEEKLLAIELEYQNSVNKQQAKTAQLDNNLANKLAEIALAKEKSANAIKQKLFNNRMRFSSVIDDIASYIDAQYASQIEALEDKLVVDKETVEDESTFIESQYNEEKANVAEVYDLEVAKEKQTIVDKDNATADSITKYNNQVEEDEQKYQINKVDMQHKADNDEQARAMDMIKSKIEMGGTAFQQMAQNQKLIVCKQYFDLIGKSEAQALMAMEGMISDNLGDYYSMLVEYVSSMAD